MRIFADVKCARTLDESALMRILALKSFKLVSF